MAGATTTGLSAFRAPSAWLPVALAAAATAVLAGYLATGPHEPNVVIENGVARVDESGAARIWQLLMLAQMPAALFFAIAWLPRDTKRAVAMLALQGAAFGLAALPIWLVGL